MGFDVVADIVAGYAAIVSTGTLAWQVRRWQSDRRGELDVEAYAFYVDELTSLIHVKLTNSNDYAVRLAVVQVTFFRAAAIFEADDVEDARQVEVRPSDENRVPSQVPPHDSVEWTWNSEDLQRLVPRFLLEPNDRVAVFVRTSLGGLFPTSATVIAPKYGH